MLELAARKIIVAVPLKQYDGSEWRATYGVAGTFCQFVCADGKCVDYDTPLAALEAAYAEWEKRNEKENPDG